MKNKAAQQLGRRGGKATSAAKAAAARENGAKCGAMGGRLPTLGVELDGGFSVVRFAWDGFGNSGGYYFGTRAELETLHAAYDPSRSLYKWIGDFATIEQAESVSDKLAYRANKQAHHSEQMELCSGPISWLQA